MIQDDSRPQIDMDEISHDFRVNKSDILQKIDAIVTQSISNGPQSHDMKSLTLVLHFYANLVVTGPEFAQKVLRETNLLCLFEYMVQDRNNDFWSKIDSAEIINNLARIAAHICKSCYRVRDENDEVQVTKEMEELSDASIALLKQILSLRGKQTCADTRENCLNAIHILGE